MSLTAKQLRFVTIVMGQKNRNLSEAYRIAYDSKGNDATVAREASRLAANPKIAPLLVEAQAQAVEKAGLQAADIVTMWHDAATVDRNELMEVRRTCCRYCWGNLFMYQETPAEYRGRLEAYENLTATTKDVKWPPFKELGGIGFNRKRDANPDCPECFGDGEMLVIIKDTRKLSHGARALYNGVKITKDGVELLVVDRSKAIENLAKHMGMVIERTLNLNAHMNVPADALPKDPVEASRAYQRMIGGE